MRGKPRLRVSENRIARKTFGHKRKQVTRNTRKVRDVALRELYHSTNVQRTISKREMRTGFWKRT